MVGFDARNKNEINPLNICWSCTLILREPVQLGCGHRQCKTCTESNEGEIIKCAECPEETPKTEIMPDRGFRNDMKQLSIQCSLCEWDGFFKDYGGHINQVHSNPICESCGKKFSSTIRFDQHKQKCAKTTVPSAPIESNGADSVCHNQSADNHYTFSPSTISTAADILQYQTSHTQNERLSEMETGIRETVSSSTPASTNVDINPQIQEIWTAMNMLATGIQTLNENRERLINEINRLNSSIVSLITDFETLRLSIQEHNTVLNGIQHNQEILQQDVPLSRQTVDDMQDISYDGTLIWRIPNVCEKMTDAQSERQTSIYSPPFYSSPTGYKMRARLYLHGDGNARRTHMSLFFVLMRGEHDAILKFPFDYKVTFCLYDQTSNQRHIIDSFRPDIESRSFQRPQSEMNIASGIPKFFPLPMIQQEDNPYVQDDTMFIKIMVDFGDIPRTLLPYVLSLNPGLPRHVQQRMIEEEAERRVEQN